MSDAFPYLGLFDEEGRLLLLVEDINGYTPDFARVLSNGGTIDVISDISYLSDVLIDRFNQQHGYE